MNYHSAVDYMLLNLMFVEYILQLCYNIFPHIKKRICFSLRVLQNSTQEYNISFFVNRNVYAKLHTDSRIGPQKINCRF